MFTPRSCLRTNTHYNQWNQTQLIVPAFFCLGQIKLVLVSPLEVLGDVMVKLFIHHTHSFPLDPLALDQVTTPCRVAT